MRGFQCSSPSSRDSSGIPSSVAAVGAVVCALLAITGCGSSGSAGSGTTGAAATTAFSVAPTATTTVPATSLATSVSPASAPSGIGVAADLHLTSADGYKYQVSWEARFSGAALNIADFPPGRAGLSGGVDGRIQIRNLTPGRNAPIGVDPLVSVGLAFPTTQGCAFQPTIGDTQYCVIELRIAPNRPSGGAIEPYPKVIGQGEMIELTLGGFNDRASNGYAEADAEHIVRLLTSDDQLVGSTVMGELSLGQRGGLGSFTHNTPCIPIVDKAGASISASCP